VLRDLLSLPPMLDVAPAPEAEPVRRVLDEPDADAR
jgi:hypothetical protein